MRIFVLNTGTWNRKRVVNADFRKKRRSLQKGPASKMAYNLGAENASKATRKRRSIESSVELSSVNAERTLSIDDESVRGKRLGVMQIYPSTC